MVLEKGFPGPWYHTRMYTKLKDLALAQLVREHKSRKPDEIVLISGVRSAESQRRMGSVKPMNRHYARLWVAPIHRWTREDCTVYLDNEGLRRNPVAEKLGRSGECLCGAYARKGELDTLEKHYPNTAAQIRDLEKEVKARGFTWGWEEAPPRGWRDSNLKKMFKDMDNPNPLCQDCSKSKL